MKNETFLFAMVWNSLLKVKLVLIPLIIFSNFLLAQNTSYVNHYTNSNFSKYIDLSKEVGVIDGSPEVSMTGGATYSIPLSLPNGVGETPKLVLTYNSQNPNGQLGLGWGLSGFSEINRSPKNYYNDYEVNPVKNDLTDVYSLDGNRLILLSGTNGAVNSIYGTENENFEEIRITSPNAYAQFEITDKNGTKREYGSTTGSTMYSNYYVSQIMSWKISKITDVNSNTVSFTYLTNDREQRVSQIVYNAGATIVNFSYKIRHDKNTVYEAGSSFSQKYLLDEISIHNNGFLYKKYQFVYSKTDLNSFLQELKEFGDDGLTQLNSTVFKYGEAGEEFSSYTLNSSGLTAVSNNIQVGDYDGDGYSDFVLTEQTYSSGLGMNVDDHFIIYRNLNGTNNYSNTYLENLQNSRIQLNDDDDVDDNNFFTHKFNSQDINGDGRDDIISTGLGLNTSNSKLYLDNISVYYGNFGAANLVKQVITPSSPYFYLPQNGRFVFPGDFDGDGRNDLITILEDDNNPVITQLNFHSPSINILNKPITTGTGFSVNTIKNADKVIPLDFDGDGKTELMVITGITCKILKITSPPGGSPNYNIECVANLNYPIYSDKLYPGDFNGDRKTDFLIYVSGMNSWFVSYSDGLYFSVGKPFYFNNNVDVANDKISIADLNGDGKSDICHSFNVWIGNVSSNMKIVPYYSKGEEFYSPGGYDNIGFVFNSNNNSQVSDVNGDGRQEICLFHPGPSSSPLNQIKVNFFKSNGEEHLLHKIVDGLLNTVEFKYSKLTNINGVYTPGSVPLLSSSGPTYDQSFPINHLIPPLSVVSELIVPDGNNGVISTTFSYEDFLFHRGGKGFLGFSKLTSQNTVFDKKTETQFLLLPDHFLLVPSSKKNFTLSSNTLLSETTQNFSVINHLNGLHHFSVLENSKDEYNALQNFHIITNSNYDNWNNLVSLSTTAGSIESSLMNTTYSIFNASIYPYPSKPISILTTKTRGTSTNSSQVDFDYNSKGQPVVKISNPNSSSPVTSYFQYDLFGNLINEQMSAINVLPSSTDFLYDVTGRYLLSITKNGVSTETFSYNYQNDKVESNTSSNCLTTNFLFDKFGRVISTITPQGYPINTVYSWYINNQLNTKYSIETAHPGKPNSLVLYDCLGRNRINKAESFDGSWSQTYTSYDVRGNIQSKSSPHLVSETPMFETYTYDNLNRLSETNNYLGTTKYTYSYSGSLSSIKIEFPNGAVNEKIFDATGKVYLNIDEGGTYNYSYNWNGDVTSTKRGALIVENNDYDQFGNRVLHYDINSSTTTYTYDAIGQLLSETDQSGNVHNFEYDNFGRVISRTGNNGEGITNYFFGIPGNNCSDQYLTKVIDFNGSITEFSYDNFGQVLTESKEINGNTYVKQYNYDIYGNMIEENYPSGFSLIKTYNSNSYLTKIQTASGQEIYDAISMNGMGGLTEYSLGNGISTSNTFQNGKIANTFSAGIQNYSLEYQSNANNILSRTDYIKNRKESFQYDNLNRLTQCQLFELQSNAPLNSPVSYLYDGIIPSKGNILKISDIGIMGYNNNAVSTVVGLNFPNPSNDPPLVISQTLQSINYTPFHKISFIEEGDNFQDFKYDENYHRVFSQKMFQNSVLETRTYFRNFEMQNINGSINNIHYIFGGNGVCAIYVEGQLSSNLYFVYKDHLGSFVSITDVNGGIVVEQNFDSWGRERNPNDWTYLNLPSKPDWLYRGFTSHETMNEFNLINMNGRLYDPVVGRMLSPDNYIQDLYNSQNLNRYSYANNNPLYYTDPSGDVVVEWLSGFIGAGGSLDRRFSEADRRVQNSYRLFAGLFDYDKSYRGRGDVYGDIWQVFSRNSYEGLQTGIGFLYNNILNIFGRVDNIKSYHGATLIYDKEKDPGVAVTLGSYITMSSLDPQSNSSTGAGSYTTMHEYGHTLQSRRSGFNYLFKYGLPSIMDAKWTELDANEKSSKYLSKYPNSEPWNQNFYGGPNSIYSSFPSSRRKNNWFEFILFYF